MKRFSAAAAFVLAFLSFDASALTLTPLPGTTPQETCVSCVFPNGIGVTARDDSGQPVPGIPVTFTTQSNILRVFREDEFCCVEPRGFITVATGADGVARATIITKRLFSATGVITASAPGAGDALFNLSTTTQMATSIQWWSGENQYAQAGTHFGAPFRFRVLFPDGNPATLTAVRFYAGTYTNAESTASFGADGPWALAITDADGIVTSPIARAETVGSLPGKVDAGMAEAGNGPVAHTAFPFNVLSYPITSRSAALVSRPPGSLELYANTSEPFVVRVLDASGAPAVNMPVTFTTDPCLSVNEDLHAVVFTDGSGIAQSPPIAGWNPETCDLRIDIPGVAAPIIVPIHVFDPAAVTVTPRQDWVTTRARHVYRVVLDFRENGQKVMPASIEAINVVRRLPGPPAGYTGNPVVEFDEGRATIELRANQYPGLYDLEIVYSGPARTRVHVLQFP
jgi:hypothetical protein